MEDLMTNVSNFCRSLEECSADLRCIVNEILDSFNTYIEEIMIALHIQIGSADTTNVQELLFQDFIELIQYLQPGLVENVTTYLRGLEDAKEDRIGNLLKTVSSFPSSPQVTAEQLRGRKIKEQEMKDIAGYVSMMCSVIQGIREQEPNDSVLDVILKKLKEHRGTFKFQNEIMCVEEINKRNLGKMIVRYIGHEGVDTNPGLRRLLQACIDFLKTETEGFWKNASITIYDEDDSMYKIISGTNKHQFICRMKGGEPVIIRKGLVLGDNKPKITYERHSNCTVT